MVPPPLLHFTFPCILMNSTDLRCHIYGTPTPLHDAFPCILKKSYKFDMSQVFLLTNYLDRKKERKNQAPPPSTKDIDYQLWGSIGITPHAYQGFPPIRLFYGSLHPLFCIFYRPLWNVPRPVKWFDFSVDAMWVNHQNHRHSEGRSASSPMFIRGFPLDDYLMTLYNPCFAYFIARS